MPLAIPQEERAYRGGDVRNLSAGCIVRLADGDATEN